MSPSPKEKRTLALARKYESEIIEHRRFFHRNPEVGLDLPVTAGYILEKLTWMGYEPQEICPSGIVALARGKEPGPTFLLRADTDALPLAEEADLPFRSVNGSMHACGHDLHAAMLLGAARVLKELEGEFPGTVKLMFQPGEEVLGGALAMIEAGVLENPKVDAALMIHVFSGLPIPLGRAAFLQAGACFASADRFDITIQGKGGHGALPDQAVDPLIALSHIHLGIQEINAREAVPGRFLTAVTGRMEGGSAANIIPDKAFMSGTIRAFDEETRSLAKKRVREVALKIGEAYRCQVEAAYSGACPSLLNDGPLLESSRGYAARLLGPERVVYGPEVGLPRLPGSEDFAFVSRMVPAIAVGLGAGVPVEGVFYPHHHPRVRFDESVLTLGTALYADLAVSWLRDQG